MTYPLPNYRFVVSLDPADVYVSPSAPNDRGPTGAGAFSDVTGLGGELQVVAQPEGGQNAFVHQLPLRHTWGRITLKKGVAHGTSLWDWFNDGLSGSLGARRDGSVTLLNADGERALCWEFRGGLAARWAGPDLSAGQGAIALETLEIVHQGLVQVDLRGA